MPDEEEPILAEYGPPAYQRPLRALKSLQWWLLVVLHVVFLLVGQAASVLLGRLYYNNGGNSTWMNTILQSAGFPLLLIPYFFLHSSDESPSLWVPPSILTLCAIYFAIGVSFVFVNILYSISLLHLSASTYSLICATQLAFNAIFSFFINHQKFTALILSSVAVLSLSSVLLALDDNSDNSPSGIPRGEYIIGLLAALTASALYSLMLSLMQVAFEKVLRKHTYSIVLEVQMYAALVTTGGALVGFFASGEWRTLQTEMDSFTTGKVGYVMTLVWTAIAWQVCSVGVVGLIFVVSSLFSNVISTLSLAVTPIASLLFLQESMDRLKVVAMVLAFGGSACYIYQNYLDDIETRKKLTDGFDVPKDSSC